MDNKLAKQYHFWSLFKFSFPTIVMMVFMSLYSIVDGIFVSRLVGTDALSAVNIVYPLLCVVMAISIMLGTGGSAIVARKMGEGDAKQAREDFSMIVAVGVILGLAVTLLGFLLIEPLLKFLGANGEIMGLCREYAQPLLWFVIPAMLQMLFQMFFVTAGKPGLGLVVTVLGGLANIVLDYLFIAQMGWGIAGAAVATGIGCAIPGLFGLIWFLFARTDTLYLVRPVWRGNVLLHTVLNGSSELVTNLSSAVITLLFNVIMMRYLGVDGVAAITIVLYAEFLLTAVYLGYSSGIAPIISYNHGEGNTQQLKRIFNISMWFLLACAVFTCAVAILFAEQMVAIFTPRETAVFTLAVHGYYLYAISYLFKGVNIYASSMFTALSDGKTSAWLSFMRTFVFIVLGMLLLPRFLGPDGIWLAVPFAELLSLILSVYSFIALFRSRWELEIRPVDDANRKRA